MKPRRCAVIITAVLYYSEFVIGHRHVPPNFFASCVNKTCVMCTPSSLRVSIRSMPCAPHPFFWLQVTIRLGHVQPLPIFASCVDGSAMCTPLSLLYVSIKSLSFDIYLLVPSIPFQPSKVPVFVRIYQKRCARASRRVSPEARARGTFAMGDGEKALIS